MKADGHCGYRVIADYLFDGGEDSFHHVSADIWHSLSTHPEWYRDAFVEDNRVEALLDIVNCGDVKKVDQEHWFTLPEMAHVVATVYNHVLVVLSPGLSLTYLPLGTAPTPESRVLCMALVNNCHFISVSEICEYVTRQFYY